MTDLVYLEIAGIILLILFNGILSMAEIAIVSSRRTKLHQEAENGNLSARKAMILKDDPNNFLSTVQIGITLIGILAGAISGATFAKYIAEALKQIPWLVPYSEALGVAFVVLIITYFTLVLGELVPKRIAMNRSERIAIRLAPMIYTLSRLARPLSAVLSASMRAILKLLRHSSEEKSKVTEEEIRILIDQGTQEGVIKEVEQDMVERVFILGDRLAVELMTPRTDIVYLDMNDPITETLQRVSESHFSRYPVVNDDLDHVVGITTANQLLSQMVTLKRITLKTISKPAIFIPATMPAFKILEEFKNTGRSMALIIDEYGSLVGLVTHNDVLSALVTDVTDATPGEEAQVVTREDGSLLLDGMLLVDELKEVLNLNYREGEEEGNYDTLSGFVMTALGRIPETGEYFETAGHRFEVMDMDGKRVDKVLVQKVADDRTTT
ncbi:MAG: HlyC/CorC family transporter [Anaerolineaceae bacterium]|nr:HlyC/CorC family transporter [Anaerolineaceae bacterium]